MNRMNEDEQKQAKQLSPNNSQMIPSSGVSSDNNEDEDDLNMLAGVASITTPSNNGCHSPSSTTSSYSSGYPTATTTTTSTNSSDVDTTKKRPSKTASSASSSTSKNTKQKKKKPTTSAARAHKPHHHPSYQQENRMLRPAPYFYYKNYSYEIDDDPLSPLSPSLTVPNFVVKLHAMLICDQFRGVVDWMGHGRSFKIWNQARFEKEVLPIFFRQGSIASFNRQANGWGFRRMLKKGPGKGSFYHERFIRGLPHLCKKMKRVGVAKLSGDAKINHEPILYDISAEHPTPPTELRKESLDWIVLNEINQSCFESGPSAKMPFLCTAQAHAKKVQASLEQNNKKPEASPGPASSLASVLLGVETGTTACAASSLLANSQSTQLNEQQNQQLLMNQYQQTMLQQTQQRPTHRTTPSSSLEEQIQVQQLLSQTNPQEASYLLQVVQEIRNHRLRAAFERQQNHQVQHQERQLTSLPQANANVTLPHLGLVDPQDRMAAFLRQYQAQQQQHSATTHDAATVSSTLSNLSSRSQQPGSQDSLAAFLQQYQAQQQQSVTTHAAATAYPSLANLLSSHRPADAQGASNPTSLVDLLSSASRQHQSTRMNLLTQSNNDSDILRQLILQQTNTTAQGQQQTLLQNSTQAQASSLQDLLARQPQQTTASALQQQTSSSSIGGTPPLPSSLTSLGGLQQRDQLVELLFQEQQKRLRDRSPQQSGQMGNQKNINP